MRRTKIQPVRLLLLVVGSAIFVMPLVWMLATALKPVDQTMTMPPQWLPLLWKMQADGEQRKVHVDKNAYEEARAAGAEAIDVLLAYQWVTQIDGRDVPVIVPTGFDGRGALDVHVEVAFNAHWRGAAHDDMPVRVLDPLDNLGGDDTVRVYVNQRDGFQFPAEVRFRDLVLRYDDTAEAVEQSYSLERTTTVPAQALRKHYVAWDDRQKLAHTQIETRPVNLADLTSDVAPRWGNFGDAVDEMKFFPRYLTNTLVLCTLMVIGTVASSSIVAYGFSRIDWPGRDKVFLIVLATMMIPFPVIMVPLYGLFRQLDWIGTLRPLWVPTFFAASAFNIFLLRQFFRTIPKELSESARIDGCSEFRIFLQIVLPLAKPALTVVALFQFLAAWNDFLGPLIYLTDQKDFTLALGLQFFQSQHGGTPWHLLMAASTLIVIPVIVLFFLAQRTFIEGVSMTGLKG